MKLKVLLMPELKSLRWSSRNLLSNIDIFKQNNIKGTMIEYNHTIIPIIIFDTNDDFLLFKLKFSDNIDKEWQEYLLEINGGYETLKRRSIRTLERTPIKRLEYQRL